MKQKYFEVIKENLKDEKKRFKNVREIMYRERYEKQKAILEAELKKAARKAQARNRKLKTKK